MTSFEDDVGTLIEHMAVRSVALSKARALLEADGSMLAAALAAGQFMRLDGLPAALLRLENASRRLREELAKCGVR